MTELSICKQKSMLKLCSELSQLLEEDPIGTAPLWEKCIIIELPPPWSVKIEESKHFDASITNCINKLNQAGHSIRLQCILPDEYYSKPGMRRVILFTKDPKFLLATHRLEYLIPEKSLTDLCISILENSEQAKIYAKFKQDHQSMRDILICTHGNRDRCCGSIAVPLYNQLRSKYSQSNNLMHSIRIWRTSHTGGHRFAPTVIDLPQGRYWAYVNELTLDSIIAKSEPIKTLIRNYRGCALLSSEQEQNAEKELLFDLGWNWVDMKKQISTIESLSKNDSHIVSAFYLEPQLNSKHGFEFKIQYTKSVPTMNCMKDGNKGLNKKYRVIKTLKSS